MTPILQKFFQMAVTAAAVLALPVCRTLAQQAPAQMDADSIAYMKMQPPAPAVPPTPEAMKAARPFARLKNQPDLPQSIGSRNTGPAVLTAQFRFAFTMAPAAWTPARLLFSFTTTAADG